MINTSILLTENFKKLMPRKSSTFIIGKAVDLSFMGGMKLKKYYFKNSFPCKVMVSKKLRVLEVDGI
jgi:hypothetical protein